jgi:O-antigen/teichoic acid export membrane protein
MTHQTLHAADRTQALAGDAPQLQLRSAVWFVLAHAAAAAASFVGAMLLARTLGAEGKGTVNLLQTTTALTSMALCIGMPGMSGYLAARGLCADRSIWLFVLGMATIGAAVAVVAVVAVGPHSLGAWISAPSTGVIWLTTVAVFPDLVMTGAAATLMGRSRSREAALVQGTVALAPVLGWALSRAVGHLTVYSAMVTWILGHYLAAVLGSFLVLRPQRESVTLPVHRFGPALSIAAPFGFSSWLTGCVQLMILRFDVILLARAAGIEAVGVYLLGVSFSELSWYVPNALFNTLFPQVAVSGAQSGAFVAQTARRLFPLVVLTSTLIYGCARLLIVPTFGPRFGEATVVCGLLIPGTITAAFPYVWSPFLVGVERPWLSTLASVVNLLTNAAACAILIPRLGSAGAALASSLSYTIGSGLMLWFFVKAAGVSVRATLVPTLDDLTELRQAFAKLSRVSARS